MLSGAHISVMHTGTLDNGHCQTSVMFAALCQAAGHSPEAMIVDRLIRLKRLIEVVKVSGMVPETAHISVEHFA